jgi:hypothetical protein
MDQAIIDRLFVRLQAIFPKWREIWTDRDELTAAKKQWTRAIVQKGLADPHMIKLGVHKAEIIGWVRPPSPAQFCDWCIESAMEQAGIPTEQDAIAKLLDLLRGGKSARKNSEMSPAVYQVCRFIDWYAMNAMAADKAEKHIARAYGLMIEHWRARKPFEERLTGVEHQEQPPVPTGEQRKKGADILRNLRKGL